ncbi:hypothetical protein D3C75_584480 [compost metagenome]
MQRMELVFHQVQGEGHLLVFEAGLNGDLLMGRQAGEQVTDLRPTVDEQARRRVPHIELRVVLHGLDEIQLILGQERVALHGQLERCSYKVIGDCNY